MNGKEGLLKVGALLAQGNNTVRRGVRRTRWLHCGRRWPDIAQETGRGGNTASLGAASHVLRASLLAVLPNPRRTHTVTDLCVDEGVVEVWGCVLVEAR